MAYSHHCTENAPLPADSLLRTERSPDINWRDTRTAAQCLSHLYLSEQLSDITFTFSAYRDVKLPAHKFVLSVCSTVFETMFYGSLPDGGKSVTLEDIDPEDMKTVLKFVYDVEPKLNGDNVLPCLYIAKKYNLSGLVAKCSEFFESNIDVSNVCQVYEHAIFFEVKPLQKRCLTFIVENNMRVFSSPGFLSLSQAALLNVLKSEELAIDEIDLCKAAMRWAEHKCKVNNKSKIGKNMRKQLGEALFQLRFPLIPIKTFAKVVAPSGILTKKELLILYQYNATQGSTPLGTFIKDLRSGATFTVDLREYDKDDRRSNTGYLLQVKFYEEPASCKQKGTTTQFGKCVQASEIKRKSLKMKSITGKFVRGVNYITKNGYYVTGYQIIENQIIFEKPIEMFDGQIVGFNTGTYGRNYNANPMACPSEKNHVSTGININRYRCTIVQFPLGTESIIFLN